MRLASHLRISRHGVYCFRLALSAPLAALIGQREIKRSLRTKDPATARLLAYGMSAKLLPILRAATRQMSIDPKSIKPGDIRELIIEGLSIGPNGTVSVSRLETTPGREREELQELARFVEQARTQPTPQQLMEREELAAAIGLGPAPAIPQELDAAIEAWLGHLKALAPSTRKSYATALGAFSSAIKSGPVHAITKGACIRYAESMLNRPSAKPPKATPAPSGVGPIIAARKAAAAPTLNPKTIRAQLNAIELFFDWAVGNGRHNGPNPMEGVARPSAPREDEGIGAEAFTPGELQAIFEPKRFNAAKRPHQFWGPLLALFTGARANEIAQLRLSDVSEEGGLHCLGITHDPNAAEATRSKNANSVRTLPIHPELLRIGFLAYLEDLKAIGATRLFPNLPIDKLGKREKYLSRDFNEKHLPAVGVHERRRKVFHSFRDTVETELHNHDASTVLVDEWMGHKPEGMGAKNYKAPFTPARFSELVLPKLRYEGLDLSALRYVPGQWNGWLAAHQKP